ncbi:vesicle-associated membrane protein 5 isoform X2 [Pipistrellus kuhlii]|uniref:vesicle-associated membrane protein 5 isoform X2 n=1 Tax=Pipistrellus kuhlii TaxID=59472 RepID=UPI001E27432B|nr:vesicle-associated membrane protein 5 isoform X2 [Pipistrellus kuhlii]
MQKQLMNASISGTTNRCLSLFQINRPAGEKLEQCQRQADEVTEIMLNNFDKVLERDGKLSELEQRSNQLLDMSSAFSKTTKTLAQKKRWENIRWRVCLGLVVGGGLLIILIVLLVIFLPQRSEGSSGPQAQDSGPASSPGG